MQPDFRQYKMTAVKYRLKFSSGLFPNMETKGYICIGLKRMLMKSKENFLSFGCKPTKTSTADVIQSMYALTKILNPDKEKITKSVDSLFLYLFC